MVLVLQELFVVSQGQRFRKSVTESQKNTEKSHLALVRTLVPTIWLTKKLNFKDRKL